MGLLEDAEAAAERQRAREAVERAEVRNRQRLAHDALDQCASEFAKVARARSIPTVRIERGRHREGWLVYMWESTNDYSIGETVLVTPSGSWYWTKNEKKVPFLWGMPRTIKVQVDERTPPQTGEATIRRAFAEALAKYL